MRVCLTTASRHLATTPGAWHIVLRERSSCLGVGVPAPPFYWPEGPHVFQFLGWWVGAVASVGIVQHTPHFISTAPHIAPHISPLLALLHGNVEGNGCLFVACMNSG